MLPVSRAAAVVGVAVFAVMVAGLTAFVDAPRWLIVGGSVLNAAFYVVVIEIVLSRIRQEELLEYDPEDGSGEPR